MTLEAEKLIYFASDFHLGAPNIDASRKREDRIVAFLTHAAKNAQEIYLVGDIFDFWFEYKSVIPKGFARLQGKLAQLSDSGIPIHFFSGNHDMWGLDYFKTELGLILHPDPVEITYNEKRFYIGHGDGLGNGDHTYKILKKFFRNPICQWLFARLHPNFGMSIASLWSGKSRIANDKKEEYLGEENEWLAVYSKEMLKHKHIDYFVFGHRHLPLDIELGPQSRYINLGEWINYQSYATFDGSELQLKYWPSVQV